MGIVTITLRFELLFGNKTQCCRVNAVALSFRIWAVVKNMPQVGIGPLAADLSTD
jgi:hypothetical protein